MWCFFCPYLLHDNCATFSTLACVFIGAVSARVFFAVVVDAAADSFCELVELAVDFEFFHCVFLCGAYMGAAACILFACFY